MSIFWKPSGNPGQTKESGHAIKVLQPDTTQYKNAAEHSIRGSCIELSMTLKRLYSLDGGDSADTALIYTYPCPFPVAKSLPFSYKYAYQGPRIVKETPDTVARVALSCGPQCYGFIAGSMDLHLFALDKSTHEIADDEADGKPSTPSHRIDTERVYRSLTVSQRPRLHFVEDAQALATVDKKKAVLIPLDFLDDQNPLVDQEAHWNLLSKRTLALSDLPSPATQVVDSVLPGDQIADETLLSTEIERMLAHLSSHPLPYVVKLPMATSGHGVWMIKQEDQRQQCVTELREALPSMFQITLAAETAAKERPVIPRLSLLIQNLVSGPADAVSVFVTKAGRAVYIGTSDQVYDDAERWLGGYMDYTRVEAKENRDHDLIQQVADYVYVRGYYGPLGFDVMTDDDGRQVVIDLNVRQTGSYVLGPMKKHFYEQRKLPLAYVICPIAVQGDRDDFEQMFAEELESGSVVIAAWCRARAGPGGLCVWSVCGVLLGAKDQAQLQALIAKVMSLKIR